MTVGNFDKEEFAEVLHQHLSPSSPIQSPEHLFGRGAQLREIEEALFARGRHIFIYGDRGVGKTSLAQTAAFRHQGADNDPILLTCGRDASFYQIINAIIVKMSGHASRDKEVTGGAVKGKISIPGFSWETERKFETKNARLAAEDMNSAVESIHTLSSKYSRKTLVVLDEFDLIKDPKEKERFADFIKQLGDQQINVQFILCGIGESLDELLGAHGSCYRYLTGIEVPRLYFDARWSIIDASSSALGITVGDDPRFRIAAISDGFPHYVHLVCEKLYWEAFNDPKPCKNVNQDHYAEAIRAAIGGIQQQLRRAYEKATMKSTDDNHRILWAAADHPNLQRRSDEIYASYQRIIRILQEEPLERKEFNSKLTELRSAGCGRILVSKRRGWHQFGESMLRGYVRLRAEAEGVMLAAEYGDTPEHQITARPRRTKPIHGWRRFGSS
jgi:uncharacterized protein